MKIRKIITIPAGTLMLVTSITPILAQEAYSMDTNTVIQICKDNIDSSSNLINDIIDGIEIEKEEQLDTEAYSEVSYSQPVTYTYVEQEIPVEQTMTVDEFMALYGAVMQEEAQQETEVVDTSVEQAAYDQALASYNVALAQYEAASQMIETTKEVEVEITEEVTDEEGNVTEVTRTEIQTVTEMIPIGDVETALANLNIAKSALDNAQTQLEAISYNAKTTVTDLVENDQSVTIDESIIVKEEKTYETSGTCGENLTWTLDDNGLLSISGTGKMNNYTAGGLASKPNTPWKDSLDSIKNVTVNDGVTHIGTLAFKGCRNLAAVTLPNSIATIGEGAFDGCTSLTEFAIPSSVTYLGESVFSGCSSLKSVTIPHGLTAIGPLTFGYCTSLNNVIIPDSVTSIGVYAFDGCSSLSDITIPTGVTFIGGDAFRGTPFLNNYDGDFVVLGDNILVKYKGNSSNPVIPSNVTSIGVAAFTGCESITDIVIPNSVIVISNQAFSACINLTNITIPDSVTGIEQFAFKDCSSLINVTIPNGVKSIGIAAFSGCSNLTTLTIPNSITEIGTWAFQECDNLTDVYYQGMEEQWTEKNLYDFGENVTIHFLEIPFIDVPQDAWYYSTAKECFETGLINGTSATTFSPMQTMTRAMVVTILWRMEGQPNVDFNDKFKDVSSSQWYANSISWAVNNSVIHGYGDGTFKPDAAVTREQVAVMLANYATYKGVYVPGTKKLNTYPDGSQVSTWAQQGMKWALTNGIISGNGAGYLSPKKSASRAEGAAMLLRMNNWL